MRIIEETIGMKKNSLTDAIHKINKLVREGSRKITLMYNTYIYKHYIIEK